MIPPEWFFYANFTGAVMIKTLGACLKMVAPSFLSTKKALWVLGGLGVRDQLSGGEWRSEQGPLGYSTEVYGQC